MKKVLTFALVAVLGISAQAQNKNAKHNLHVKGNCGQCKERIENAAYGVKGVKTASWDEDTHNLSIVLNETKSNITAVEDAIVAVGHDTNDKKATEKAYKALHSCCLYEREEVAGEHPTEANPTNENHSNHHH